MGTARVRCSPPPDRPQAPMPPAPALGALATGDRRPAGPQTRRRLAALCDQLRPSGPRAAYVGGCAGSGPQASSPLTGAFMPLGYQTSSRLSGHRRRARMRKPRERDRLWPFGQTRQTRLPPQAQGAVRVRACAPAAPPPHAGPAAVRRLDWRQPTGPRPSRISTRSPIPGGGCAGGLRPVARRAPHRLTRAPPPRGRRSAPVPPAGRARRRGARTPHPPPPPAPAAPADATTPRNTGGPSGR